MSAENPRPRARKEPANEHPQQGRRDDLDSCQRETLNALVGEQMLHALGEPPDLLSVQVRPLWDGHYRVNVFVGADSASARLAHSYFVVLDADGNLLRSTPTILHFG